ncbi:hypothetical protein T484DRAFT_1874281 [Baffinella frigidus]|nr:hypothetical protein T484DRAFT_1874281 [Cryptophyta sp. CCMP2293]
MDLQGWILQATAALAKTQGKEGIDAALPEYLTPGTSSQLYSAAAASASSPDPAPEETLKAAAQLALAALEWRRESRYAQPEMLQAAQLKCAEECGLLYLSPVRATDGRCVVYGRARQDPWDPESGETLALMVRVAEQARVASGEAVGPALQVAVVLDRTGSHETHTELSRVAVVLDLTGCHHTHIEISTAMSHLAAGFPGLLSSLTLLNVPPQLETTVTDLLLLSSPVARERVRWWPLGAEIPAEATAHLLEQFGSAALEEAAFGGGRVPRSLIEKGCRAAHATAVIARMDAVTTLLSAG